MLLVLYLSSHTYAHIYIHTDTKYTSPPSPPAPSLPPRPFGVFSDMLGTPNQYRGMLFGSTGRFGCANPTPMWQFWDAFNIADTDMVGWWEPEAPVTVIDGYALEIHATAYVNKVAKKTLVALASWSPSNATVGERLSSFTTENTEEGCMLLILCIPWERKS